MTREVCGSMFLRHRARSVLDVYKRLLFQSSRCDQLEDGDQNVLIGVVWLMVVLVFACVLLL